MRIFFFIVITLTAFLLPWWFACCLALIYMFFYSGIELLFLAALLDAYYGTVFGSMPFPILYTTTTLAFLILINYFKPYLIFHE